MTNKNDNISKIYFKQYFTESKEIDASSPFEINLGKRYLLTAQDCNNKQKLLDFISDKKKITLKSVFDHKGTKAFLNEKNEAMKRIELDENIESIKKIKEKREIITIEGIENQQIFY